MSAKVLSKAINSHWIIAGTSEETMLSSKLAAVGKKDPRRGVAMGQYIPKWVWDHILPRHLYFAGVLQRDMFIYARGMDVESEGEPRLLWSQSSSSCQPGMDSLWLHTNIKLYLRPPGVPLLGLGVSPGLFTL